MRIGHCQFETWCGEFEHNLKRVEDGLARAEKDRVEIVSFPECFLTGYPDTAEAARKGAFRADSPEMMRVLDLTSRFDPTLIVGFNEVRGTELYKPDGLHRAQRSEAAIQTWVERFAGAGGRALI